MARARRPSEHFCFVPAGGPRRREPREFEVIGSDKMPSSFNFIVRPLAALLFLSSASLSLAQETAGGSTPTPPAWALNCVSPDAASGALDCQIAQRFYRQQTGELVMVLAISKKSEDAAFSMDLVLPHGLNLPSGVSYQVDDGETKIAAINSSGQNGAVTSIPLSPDILAVLKAGSTLTVKMQTATGAELSIPLSLAGFTAAVDRLSAIK